MSTILSGDDNMNNEIPVPDPFAKDYEYFFPSASWDNNGIIPVSTNDTYTTFPFTQEIDIKIPEQ